MKKGIDFCKIYGIIKKKQKAPVSAREDI